MRLILEPPANAVRWKLLRKGSDSFTDIDDAAAFLAFDGDDKVITDTGFLQNATMYFYRPFYTADGTTWTPGNTASGTPAATYAEDTSDAFSLVRDRLEAGLKVECDRGTFATELGYIQVYTAPPGMEDSLRFPLVTMHYEGTGRGESGIGESIGSDDFDAIGDDWSENEGWLSNDQIQVVGWCLNSDERVDLRKALRRIIIGNLSIFSAAGIDQVDFQQSDLDFLEGEFGAPMYQISCNFSCLAPVSVGGRTPAVHDITIEATNV